MNDYDFGKYYRQNNRPAANQKSGNNLVHNFYRKVSIAVAAGLILFFAGLFTGMHFQSNKIIHNAAKIDDKNSDNSGVVNSADISPESMALPKNSSGNHDSVQSSSADDVQKIQPELKKSLMDPENEYIILAKKYNEDSKDRALYYAGILNKATADYNYEVLPSIRGKTIKLYLGPMKGKKMAEKMLARVKSIPEFTNSAILYKK